MGSTSSMETRKIEFQTLIFQNKILLLTAFSFRFLVAGSALSQFDEIKRRLNGGFSRFSKSRAYFQEVGNLVTALESDTKKASLLEESLLKEAANVAIVAHVAASVARSRKSTGDVKNADTVSSSTSIFWTMSTVDDTVMEALFSREFFNFQLFHVRLF